MTLDQEIQRMADRYAAQGYAVTVRPGPDDLPAFAHDFRVEIVGRRGAEGVLVAVKKSRREFAADPAMSGYAEAVAGHPDWRFDIVLVEREDPKFRDISDARDFSGEEIDKSLADAVSIAGLGFGRAATITAWAGLEAAMRMRLRAGGEAAGWGTPPREMLNELYSSGLLSADEFRRLGALTQFRNQIVHGFSPPASAAPAESDAVQLLSDVARRLVGESQPA